MNFTTVDVVKNENTIIFKTPVFDFAIPFTDVGIQQSVFFKKDSNFVVGPDFLRWVGSFFSNLDVLAAIPTGQYVMPVKCSIENRKYTWPKNKIVYSKPVTGAVVLIDVETAKAHEIVIKHVRKKGRKVTLRPYMFSFDTIEMDIHTRTKIFDLNCKRSVVTINFLGHEEIVRGAEFFSKDGKKYFRLFYGAGAGEIVVPWDTVHLLLASVRLQRNDGSKFKVYL